MSCARRGQADQCVHQGPAFRTLMRALTGIRLPACVLSRYGGPRRAPHPANASRQSGATTKFAEEPVTTPVHDADTHLIPESTTSSPSNERDRPGREVPAILIPCPGDCTMSCSTVPTQPL